MARPPRPPVVRDLPVREGRVVDRVRRVGRVTVDVAEARSEPREGRRATAVCRVTGRVDGRTVLDDEVRIVNPPTLVPDPEGDVVRREVDEDGNVISERRFREDPEGALVEVLAWLVEQRETRPRRDRREVSR